MVKSSGPTLSILPWCLQGPITRRAGEEKPLAELLPPTISWFERGVAQADGIPLDKAGIRIAKTVGVKHPERVRVVQCEEQLPIPDNQDARDAYFKFFREAVAVTIGYVVWVRRKSMQDPRIARLILSHELRHVQQFEQTSSIAEFVTNLLKEINCSGYRDSFYERDARNHSSDVCRIFTDAVEG
jgi:hypothetical protein